MPDKVRSTMRNEPEQRDGYVPNSTVKKLRSNWLTGQHEGWDVWSTDEHGNLKELIEQRPLRRRIPRVK